MDFFTELEITDQGHGPNWFCNAQQINETDKIMEISPFDGFFGLNWAAQLPYQSKKLCFNEFRDLENFSFDFNLLPPLDEDFHDVDHKPLNILLPEPPAAASVKKEENQEMVPLALPSSSSSSSEKKKKKKKKKSSALEFDEIKKHFGVPITVAAKEMNVGLTHLKRRCRELNIMRWPHRKLKSLELLIDSVKEMGLANEVAKLEKHKKMLEKIPGLELNEETKKLRQAFFKTNYKRRRFMALRT